MSPQNKADQQGMNDTIFWVMSRVSALGRKRPFPYAML